MIKTNFNEEIEITEEIENEIEMQKNVYLKQYTEREKFIDQLSKFSIFFTHLTGLSNWNVLCNFMDDVDNDIRHYTADIYIERSRFKKYKFYYSFEMVDGLRKYVFLNDYYRLFYESDNFEELFTKMCDDHLNVYTSWILELRKEMKV